MSGERREMGWKIYREIMNDIAASVRMLLARTLQGLLVSEESPKI